MLPKCWKTEVNRESRTFSARRSYDDKSSERMGIGHFQCERRMNVRKQSAVARDFASPSGEIPKFRQTVIENREASPHHNSKKATFCCH